MAKEKLSDAEAKASLLKWPTRTKVWPPPGGRGFWLRGQPKDAKRPGPRISSPGARLFNTQPDGLWVHFGPEGISCDLVAVEACGTIQNLNDKRSRYIPSSHSLVLSCSKLWFEEEIRTKKGRKRARWAATNSFKECPTRDVRVPIRHLRVLYAIQNSLYHKWCREHTPTGYEFFCPHSSLGSFTSQAMQKFLRSMSSASHFRVIVKPE